MAEAVAAGAVGFLLKDCDPRDLVGAVCSVARGQGPLDPRLADDRWWEPPRWLPGLRRSHQPRVAAQGRAVNAR
jgi:DNA-binding NarL/FixJ family response regulator